MIPVLVRHDLRILYPLHCFSVKLQSFVKGGKSQMPDSKGGCAYGFPRQRGCRRQGWFSSSKSKESGRGLSFCHSELQLTARLTDLGEDVCHLSWSLAHACDNAAPRVEAKPLYSWVFISSHLRSPLSPWVSLAMSSQFEDPSLLCFRLKQTRSALEF